MARVLLVDDDADALEIRRLVFERHGHRVMVAPSVGRARELFFAEAPECVVLDLRIPEAADGLGLVREFRRALPGVRIIVVSGWPVDIEARAEASMVDLVLAKPVRSEVLLAAVG
jgi:DNA-binding response OmpR family regulator